MIDWITATVPLPHDGNIFGDYVCCVDQAGEVKWQARKFRAIEGSYSTRVHVRSESPFAVTFSGNPVKFLQGHNLFGTDDLVGLTALFMERLCHELGISVAGATREGWWAGGFELHRVDINYGYSLRNRADVKAWIRSAANLGQMKHRGAGQLKGDTLYYGKNSRRWSLKAYAKGQEIELKGRRLAAPLDTPQMRDYADNKLRVELVLRSMELKRLGLGVGSAWHSGTAAEVFTSKVGTLEVSENVRLTPGEVDDLPPRLRSTYTLWREGYDLRELLSRPTFYRHRAELREHGIDIAVKLDRDTSMDNVVPMMRVLEAVPAPVPDWAIGTPLYVDPRKTRVA